MYNYNHHYVNITEFIHPEKVIRPNMENYVATLKTKKMFSILGVVICFIAFIVIPMSMMGSRFTFGYVFIPFIGFGIFGFLMSINTSKYRIAYEILLIIRQIEGNDKILIKNISYTFSNADSDKLFIIKLLMEKDNLIDYEIIDDVLVAKKTLNIKNANLDNNENEYSYKQTKNYGLHFCPYCGKDVNQNDLYCKSCGKRLK